MAMVASRRSHFTGKAFYYFGVNHRYDDDSDIISVAIIPEGVWGEDVWEDVWEDI